MTSFAFSLRVETAKAVNSWPVIAAARATRFLISGAKRKFSRSLFLVVTFLSLGAAISHSFLRSGNLPPQSYNTEFDALQANWLLSRIKRSVAKQGRSRRGERLMLPHLSVAG